MRTVFPSSCFQREGLLGHPLGMFAHLFLQLPDSLPTLQFALSSKLRNWEEREVAGPRTNRH